MSQTQNIFIPLSEGDGKVFVNPICKQTYDSLPRIYGNKKKYKSKLISIIKPKPKKIQQTTEEDNDKKISRIYDPQVAEKLSKPKRHKCSKKNCLCHFLNDNQIKKKENVHKRISFVKSNKLPVVQAFDLDDLETAHKVSFKRIETDNHERGSGLSKIIQQTKKSHTKSTSSQQNNLLGLKYKLKPIFNHSNSQTQSNAEKVSSQPRKEKISKFRKLTEMKDYSLQIDTSRIGGSSDEESAPLKKRKINHRFKTEEASISGQGSKFVLSTSIFRSSQRQNTQFHHFNKNAEKQSQNQLRKTLLHSKLSIKYFKVPEESEYIKFLSQYKCLDKEFNLKEMVKSKHFCVIKEEKGVYFGEVDEEENKHGKGINITEKLIFQGLYQKNQKVNGSQRTTDSIFQGSFINGLRSGQGFLRLENGETFEGTWKNGKKNGIIKWRSPSGDYCEGEWKDDKQNGNGIFKHKKSTYTGEFVNFLKHGYGEEKFTNGDFYKGEYINGKPEGKGTYQWNHGVKYEGQFKDGMREGKGKNIDEDGTIYEGEWSEDFKHGFGEEVYRSGEKYVGTFEKGSRGEGKLFNAEGIEIDIIKINK